MGMGHKLATVLRRVVVAVVVRIVHESHRNWIPKGA
jgi:hypothetical protein